MEEEKIIDADIVAVDGSRKDLYRMLLADKAVADRVKKYSFKQFENKLLSDTETQDKLGNYLMSIGKVSDPMEFSSKYLQVDRGEPSQQFASTPTPTPTPVVTQPVKETPGLIQKGWEAVKGLFGGEPEPAQKLVQPLQFESDAQKEQSALSPVFQDHEAAKLPAIFQTKEAERRTGLTPEQKQQAIEGSSGHQLSVNADNDKKSMMQRAGETVSGLATSAATQSDAALAFLDSVINPLSYAPGATKSIEEGGLGGYENISKEYRKEAIRTAQEGQKELSAKINELGLSTDIVDAIKSGRASDIIQAINHNIGQMAYQVPLAISTFGASGFAMEGAEAYQNIVEAQAKELGITPEELINKGLDKHALATAVGVVSGAIDYLGAKQLAKFIQAGGAYEQLAKAIAAKLPKKYGAPLLIRPVVAGNAEGFGEAVQEGMKLGGERIATGKWDPNGWNRIGRSYANAATGATGTYVGAKSAIGIPSVIRDIRTELSKPPTQLGGQPTIPAPEGPNPDFEPEVVDPTGDGVVAPVGEEVAGGGVGTDISAVEKKLDQLRQKFIDNGKSESDADELALNSISDQERQLLRDAYNEGLNNKTNQSSNQINIQNEELFRDGTLFANQLGGSGVNSVPSNSQIINGIEFVQFSNPNTGEVDVIMSGTSDTDYVGFYRIYENGKPTNKWSSKFENQSRNKDNFKTMISGVQQMLPDGHEYTEKTSISTDGLRVWGQQLNRGYELQTDENGNLITNEVAINGDAINNELGISVNQGGFDNISVTNNKDFNKVKQALLPYLQQFGLSEKNIHNINGTVYIDLPVLRKSSSADLNQPITQNETNDTPAVAATEGNGNTGETEVQAEVVAPTDEPTTSGDGKSYLIKVDSIEDIPEGRTGYMDEQGQHWYFEPIKQPPISRPINPRQNAANAYMEALRQNGTMEVTFPAEVAQQLKEDLGIEVIVDEDAGTITLPAPSNETPPTSPLIPNQPAPPSLAVDRGPVLEPAPVEVGTDVLPTVGEETVEERIRKIGMDAEVNFGKYFTKISANKWEATNPFTNEKVFFDRKEKAAQYVFDQAVRARTKGGRTEIANENSSINDGSVINQPASVEPTGEAGTQKPVVAATAGKLKQSDTMLAEGVTHIKKIGEAPYLLLKTAMDRGVIPERLFNDFGAALSKVKKGKKATEGVAVIIQQFMARENIKDSSLDIAIQDAANKEFDARIKELDKYVQPDELAENEVADKIEAIMNSENPSKEDVDFVNENAFLPQGFRFSKDGLVAEGIEQKYKPKKERTNTEKAFGMPQTKENMEAFWTSLRDNAKEISQFSVNEMNDWMVENHSQFYEDDIPPLRYISPTAENDALKRYIETAKSFAQQQPPIPPTPPNKPSKNENTETASNSVTGKPNPFIAKVRKSFQGALKALGLKANVEFISDEEAKRIIDNNEDYKARLAAFHGSPHDFDRFSTDKIGTGEGAQAFGWGLYFTDLEGIARGYANAISASKTTGGRTHYYSESEFDKYLSELTDSKKIKDWAKGFTGGKFPKLDGVYYHILHEKDGRTFIDVVRDIANNPNTKTMSDSQFEDIMGIGKKEFLDFAKNFNRTLYKVSLHDNKDPSEYDWLSWDKGITKSQSQAIRKQAEKEGVESGFSGPDPYLKFSEDQVTSDSGGEFYKALQDSNKWTPKQASEFLLRAGIDGIKYPAESLARGTTSDNARGFNYVVFDENAVKIEEKIQYMKGPQGTILGFVQPQPDGSYKIWIDPKTTDAETPIHELGGHIFLPLLKEAAPELHARGTELIQNTPYLKAAQDLGLEGDAANEEALAQAIGEKGKQLSSQQKPKFLEWLNSMWQKVGEKLGLSVPIKDLTLGEFTDLIAGSVLHGDKLSVAKPLTPSQKLAAAHAKWKASHNNLGIIFDPYSNAKSDIEFLGAILEYAKEKAIQTYDQFKAILKEYGVYDESKDKEWREVWDGSKPKKTEPAEGEAEKPVVNRLRKGTKDEALQAELERLGLFRPVMNMAETTAKGQKLYEAMGNEGSLEALKNDNLDRLTALGLHRALTEGLQDQLEKNTDPEMAVQLIGQQALAMNLVSKYVTQGGQVLRYWQDTLDNSVLPYDYTARIDAMKKDFPVFYEANKEEIEAAFKEAKELMDKAIADRKQLDNDIAEWELQKSIEDVAASVAKEKKAREPQKYGATNKIIKRDQFEKDAEVLKKMFAGRSGQLFSAGIPPELVRVAAFHVEAGARSLAAFSKKMIDQFGDQIKPYLDDAYKAGLEELKKANAKSEEVEVVDGKIKVPHALIRQYVEDGVTDPRDLVRLIHEDLKVEHPEITEKQVRDAISGYGKTVGQTGDEIDKQIRELKSLMQKISQLEDIEKQLRPMKTGLQRDKLTARQRELAKQVREALKTLPLSEEESAKHLKTTLDGIKTRLRNEIEDIDKQIAEGKKKAKSEGTTYDEEANTLKDQRDERKKILDDITANPEQDIQDRIAKALEAIEESTKKYEDQIARIKAGKPIEPGSSNPLYPDTPELKAAKAARDQARKDRDNLLKKAPKSPEQIKLERLQKQLDALLFGKIPDTKDKTVDSPAVKALKDQIARQKELLGLKNAKRTADEIATDNAVAAKERRLAELDEEIAALEKGQEKNRPKTEAKRSDRIKELDTLLKAANETRKKLRDEAGITERERLKSWKGNAQSQINRLNQRRAKGDFSTKPRKAPPQFDVEAERIEDEKFRAKELYDEKFRQAQDAAKSWKTKALNFAYDVWFNLSRGIVTGLDLGILAIQGAPLTMLSLFKDPKIAKRAFIDGAKALLSEEEYLRQSAKTKESPDYRTMRKSSLALVNPHAHEGDIHKEESAFGNIVEQLWDKSFELPAKLLPESAEKVVTTFGQKSNPISALNRAQAAYMNTLRVGMFLNGAAMLKAKGITFQNDPEAYQQFADAVNTFSGRASLFGLEKSPGWYKALSGVFFSPRNWMSILKTITPFGPLYFSTKNAGRTGGILSPAQRLYAEVLLSNVGLTMGYLVMMKALGGWKDDDEPEEKDVPTVNMTDPRKADYMRVKINGQLYDPWGGKQPQIVLQARLAAAALDMDHQYTNLTSGEKSRLTDDKRTYAWNLIKQNVRNKANSLPSFAMKMADSAPVEGEDGLRETADGEVFRTKDAMLDLVTPMTFGSTKETWERQNGAYLPFFLTQGVTGFGVTTLDKERIQTSAKKAAAIYSPNAEAEKKAKESFRAAIETGNKESAKEYIQKLMDTQETKTEKYIAVKGVVKEATSEKELTDRVGIAENDLDEFFKVLENQSVKAGGPKKMIRVERMKKIASDPELSKYFKDRLSKEYESAKKTINLANEMKVRSAVTGLPIEFQEPVWMKKYERIVLKHGT